MIYLLLTQPIDERSVKSYFKTSKSSGVTEFYLQGVSEICFKSGIENLWLFTT
jgi:hypothetical protein